MTDVTTLTAQAEQDLRNRAVADFIALVGTSVEAIDADVDLGEWISEQTQHWTADHGRMGVLVCGMLLTAGGIDAEALAAIGRALIVHPDQE